MTDANSSRCVSRDATGSTGTRRSGGEPLAALAATGGDDGATGTGAHPQPEPVLARTAAVVRLEGALALAHFSALLVDNRHAGAAGRHLAGVGQVPVAGARLLARVRSAAEGGQTGPGAVDVLWAIAPGC